MVVVSFQMPDVLDKRLEDLVREFGYASKSEAIREAIKMLIQGHSRKDKEELFAVLARKKVF